MSRRRTSLSIFTAEDRAAMGDSFARLLSERSTESDVRRTMQTESGYDVDLWNDMCEMGVVGTLVDQAYGGLGASMIEVEMLMERAGGALLCSPFLSSSVLAASLLRASCDAAAKMRLLPAIAAGKLIATVAFTGERGLWTPDDVTVAARSTPHCSLSGVAWYVTFGARADVLLVVAKEADGLAAFEVDRNSAVRIEPLQTWDQSQRLSKVTFADAPAMRIAGVDAAAIEEARDCALVALAGEQVGAARKIFEMTIEYVKSRVQFGRPVGGFQAIKHMAADLLLEVESATSAARQAAQALAQRASDAHGLISLAAFACADAFSQVAAAAIQMHGGIAFTWDHPAHLYLRRARADAQLFGSPDYYRERYLSELEKVTGCEENRLEQ